MHCSPACARRIIDFISQQLRTIANRPDSFYPDRFDADEYDLGPTPVRTAEVLRFLQRLLKRSLCLERNCDSTPPAL